MSEGVSAQSGSCCEGDNMPASSMRASSFGCHPGRTVESGDRRLKPEMEKKLTKLNEIPGVEEAMIQVDLLSMRCSIRRCPYEPYSHSQQFCRAGQAIPGGEMLMMCFSCGTCTSKCMIQEKLEPNYNPRRLIREAVFNFEDTAFSDETTCYVLPAICAILPVRKKFIFLV